MESIRQSVRTESLAAPLTLNQRVTVILILSSLLAYSLSQQKFYWSSVIGIATLLTAVGFSRNKLLQKVSLHFASLVAHLATRLARILIQIIYLLIIASFNLILRKLIARQNFRVSNSIPILKQPPFSLVDFNSYY
jgi:hypothetical protein